MLNKILYCVKVFLCLLQRQANFMLLSLIIDELKTHTRLRKRHTINKATASFPEWITTAAAEIKSHLGWHRNAGSSNNPKQCVTNLL